jgi:hypothetical protein
MSRKGNCYDNAVAEIGNGYTKRSAMSVPSSLKPKTLSPFGGVYEIGASSSRPLFFYSEALHNQRPRR